MESTHRYQIADEETYQEGQVIFKEGGPGDWVYLILSGSVKISRKFEGRHQGIAVLHAGEVFGELEFLGGMRKRTVTARALQDTTLGVVDRAFLEKEYNQLSAQFRGLIRALGEQHKKLLDRICDLQSRTQTKYPKVISLSYKDKDSFLRAYSASTMGTGGLFIKTEKLFPIGHRFLLKLSLPGISEPLLIKSEVVWARKAEDAGKDQKPGMGIKFREITKRDFHALREFLGEEHPSALGP